MIRAIPFNNPLGTGRINVIDVESTLQQRNVPSAKGSLPFVVECFDKWRTSGIGVGPCVIYAIYSANRALCLRRCVAYQLFTDDRQLYVTFKVDNVPAQLKEQLTLKSRHVSLTSEHGWRCTD